MVLFTKKFIKILVLVIFLIILLNFNSIALEDKRININVKEIELNDALRTIAELADVNLIIDGSVKGNITLHLKEVSFADAIKLISNSRGLDWRYEENTVYIASEERIDKLYNEKVIKEIKIKNRKVNTIKEIIKKIYPNLTISIDSQENKIILKENKEKVSEIVEIIKSLDIKNNNETTKRIYKFIDIPDINIKKLKSLVSIIYPKVKILYFDKSSKLMLYGKKNDINKTYKIIKDKLNFKNKKEKISKKLIIKPEEYKKLHYIFQNPNSEISSVYDKNNHCIVINGYKKEVNKILNLYQETKKRINTSNIVKTLNINYIDTDSIKSISNKLFSEIKFFIDDKRKFITLSGDKEKIEKFITLLKKIDKPRLQIIIEASIIEISTTNLKKIGIAPGQLGEISVISKNDKQLDLNLNWPDFIQMLREKANAKTLAAPCLATLNGEEAELLIGNKIPIKITAKNEEKIKYIEAGIKLSFLPQITNNDEIILSINPKVSSIGEKIGNSLPAINTRQVKTKIRLKDSEVFALAGLIQDDIIKSEERVPVLSNIPLIKNFFKRNSENRRRSEVVILITPHIIRNSADITNNLTYKEGKKPLDIEDINVWKHKMKIINNNYN